VRSDGPAVKSGREDVNRRRLSLTKKAQKRGNWRIAEKWRPKTAKMGYGTLNMAFLRIPSQRGAS
jgi:hypothetical protein